MIKFELYNGNRQEFETFRNKALAEGNDSLIPEKFDPDTLDGETWCAYLYDELVSVCVVESSHYTHDPDVAARACRLHVLKDCRPSWIGLMYPPYLIESAQRMGFKILYMTHDIHNRSLNAMYQHKRRGGAFTNNQILNSSLWDTPEYQALKMERRFLFKVDPKVDFYQFVYYWEIDPDFTWMPKSNVVWYPHDGTINKKQLIEIMNHGN